MVAAMETETDASLGLSGLTYETRNLGGLLS